MASKTTRYTKDQFDRFTSELLETKIAKYKRNIALLKESTFGKDDTIDSFDTNTTPEEISEYFKRIIQEYGLDYKLINKYAYDIVQKIAAIAKQCPDKEDAFHKLSDPIAHLLMGYMARYGEGSEKRMRQNAGNPNIKDDPKGREEALANTDIWSKGY